MDSGYTSGRLSHFVGSRHPLDHEANYRTLLEVIKSGSVSHPRYRGSPYGGIEVSVDRNGSLEHETMVVGAVTCYCDIPRDHLRIHLTKYGLFGLAFPRELLVKYGARPVPYMPHSMTDYWSIYGRFLIRDIETAYRAFLERVSDPIADTIPSKRVVNKRSPSREEAIDSLKSTFERDFLAFVKPFSADATIETFENYYLEREWRKYGNTPVDITTVAAVYLGEEFVERFKQDCPQFADRIDPLPMDWPLLTR